MGALPWVLGAGFLWLASRSDSAGEGTAIEESEAVPKGARRTFLMATPPGGGPEAIGGHVKVGASTAKLRAMMNRMLSNVGRAPVTAFRDLDAVADTAVRVVLGRHPTITDGTWQIAVGFENPDRATRTLKELRKVMPGWDWTTRDEFWPGELLTGIAVEGGRTKRAEAPGVTSMLIPDLG